MRKQFIVFFTMFLTAQVSLAQNSFKVTVKDESTKEPVTGAMVTIRDRGISGTTDAQGVTQLNNIPDGEQTIIIFFPGYESKELKFTFPLTGRSESLIFIQVTNEVGEVTITSTRTGREIDDVPTRVEAIDEEEVDEKTNMRPANVSMVLNESTGIKVQQTSATSNTQSVRIQGLDGRYTQLLKDGFPAFGGFSGSISLLDILPLDLKQVEIIRDYGTFALPRVSTLYRFTPHLSSRLSFGLGYKAPSIFTEEAETLLFQNVLPIGNTLKAERSRGSTMDVNYRNTLGEQFSYSFNQMFFYTEIEDPLVLLETATGNFRFLNAQRPVRSRGFETNARLTYDVVKLFAGYTLVQAKATYLAGNKTLPLTPKSRINSALLF